MMLCCASGWRCFSLQWKPPVLQLMQGSPTALRTKEVSIWTVIVYHIQSGIVSIILVRPAVIAWSARMRYHLHSWYFYHEMPSKWWKVWSRGTMRVSGGHIHPTARNWCTRLTYVNHCKGRDTWNGESDWYTITKTVRGRGLAVSICAELNGRSTSGLKMEPKCIAIIQAMELGNPLVLLSQVG